MLFTLSTYILLLPLLISPPFFLCASIVHSSLELTIFSHLAYNAVLHVCLLVAALFAHQCDLKLTKRFGQDVTLGEKLSPLYNVGL